MGANPSYLPTKDAAFDAWLANFSTLITANPSQYGLTAADAVAIATPVAAWHTAYLAATSPSTKSKTAVATKDTARVTVSATVRPYAQTIALNAAVATADKIALGLNPHTSTPVPIAAPTTNPVLTIDQALSLSHVVRYRDSSASPSSKSKPYGVVQCQVFAAASATPITDPTLLAYKMVSTKSPFQVTWPPANVGQKAYYAARWITKKGLTGPWSPIVGFTIAG